MKNAASAPKMPNIPLPGPLGRSVFREADNDDRDELLTYLIDRGSARVLGPSSKTQQFGLENCADFKVEIRYDRERRTLSGAAAARLISSGMAGLSDWTNTKGQVAKATVTLTSGIEISAWEQSPREHAVEFGLFEENCRHRRFFGEQSCTNKDGNGMCSLGTCPLVEHIYASEDKDAAQGDPFFTAGLRADNPAALAVPKTTAAGVTESEAWKAAGAHRIDTIVNRCTWAAQSVLNGYYLAGTGEAVAAMQAIELGRLSLVKLTRLGPIVRLPDAALAQHQAVYLKENSGPE
jgi:hypothetical protein